jgi:nanoRNase/pAp phosphatase (c-di-AMP/oligoRNAs hydrolase)
LIMFKIDENEIKISFRSRSPKINNWIQPILANEIASHFEGGGHSYAAGAKIKRKNKDAMMQIQEILEAIMTWKNKKIESIIEK